MIRVFSSGQILLSNSCFGHRNPLPLGFVTVESTSSILSNENVFSTHPVSSEFCNGIYETANAFCFTFDAQKCPIADQNSCYTDWNDLQEDISLAANSRVGGTFTICPGSVFILSEDEEDSPLVVSVSNTVIQCGEEGALDNDCIIFGGSNQVSIQGSPQNVHFNGISFLGSLSVSVLAGGASEAKATFSECEFAGHVGSAVALVFNEDAGMDDDFIPGSEFSVSMAVHFSHCIFQVNKSMQHCCCSILWHTHLFAARHFVSSHFVLE